MANNIDWGKGAVNNSIGWGQGFNNSIGWGSVYETSNTGDTNIFGASPNFILRVKTDNAGTSNNDQVTLPLVGTYDIEYDGQVLTNQTGTITLTMPSGPGEYDIKVSSSGLMQILSSTTGDVDKYLDIKNWGDIQWQVIQFNGCSNLNISATDIPDLSNIINFASSFRSCTSLIWNDTVNQWDVSNVADFNNMFNTTPLFNQPLNGWNVSNGTNFLRFLQGSGFDQTLANWNIANVLTMENFMRFSTLSTANYNATLIGWEATLQAAFPNGVGYTPTISINFGGSQFTLGSLAETARTSLINNFGWTITDGGGI